MDNVALFISEYEALCRRTNLSIGVLTDGTLGLFRLDCEDNAAEFEATVGRWREEAGDNGGSD